MYLDMQGITMTQQKWPFCDPLDDLMDFSINRLLINKL